MNYMYPLLLILSFFTLGVDAQTTYEFSQEGDSTEFIINDFSQTIKDIADILNTPMNLDASNETPLRTFCDALKVSSTKTMLQYSLDGFYDNLQKASLQDSKLDVLLKTLKAHSSTGSTGIDDEFFFDGLAYELKCPNDDNLIYMYHFVLLENPILIQELIARSNGRIQREQFSRKRLYNNKSEDLLSLAKSYLPEMRQSILKNFYIKAVRLIKRQIESNE